MKKVKENLVNVIFTAVAPEGCKKVYILGNSIKSGRWQTYAAKKMTIMLHDREGLPIHQWICYNLFPTSALPEPPLSYDNSAIWQSFSVTFWCDYYDEAIL